VGRLIRRFRVWLFGRAPLSRDVADGFEGFGRVNVAREDGLYAQSVKPHSGSVVRDTEFIGDFLYGQTCHWHSFLSAKKVEKKVVWCLTYCAIYSTIKTWNGKPFPPCAARVPPRIVRRGA